MIWRPPTKQRDEFGSNFSSSQRVTAAMNKGFGTETMRINVLVLEDSLLLFEACHCYGIMEIESKDSAAQLSHSTARPLRTCTNTVSLSNSTISRPPFFSALPANTSTSILVTSPLVSRASNCGLLLSLSIPGFTISETRLSFTLTKRRYGRLVRATGTCGVMSRCV